jgi:uncharacterized protein YgiM (DUF1202 family)
VNPAILRIVKAAVGTIVLIALLVTVNRWWGEYRDQSAPPKPVTKAEEAAPKGEDKAPASESQEQPTTESNAPAPAPTKTRIVVVKTDGLNFRKEPARDANVIRGLDKGEKLTYLKEDGGWFQVQDAEGVKGWISSKSQYAELQ